MSQRGSSGNVLAGACSFFVPGLGQLLQGRILAGVFFWFAAVACWLVLMGWVFHLVAAVDAANWEGR